MPKKCPVAWRKKKLNKGSKDINDTAGEVSEETENLLVGDWRKQDPVI